MPRFLVISDLHLHPFVGVPLEHQSNILSSVINYAQEKSIRNMLCCGDVFHTHSKINTHALHIWNQFLYDLKIAGITLSVISGNHDHYTKDGSITALAGVRLTGGNFLEQGEVVEIDGVPVKGFQYIDDPEALQSLLIRGDYPQDCILLMHQGVSGVELNSKGFTLDEALHPSMIPSSVLHCFSGHFHSRKRVSPNLTIPGALFQHNFSDSEDVRGFLDVIVNNTITINPVLNEIPEFEKVSFENFERGLFNQLSLNLKVTDVPSESAIKDLKMDYSSNMYIEYSSKELTSPDVIKSETFSTFDFFDEYIKARKLSEEEIRIGREIIYGRA